MAQFLSSEASEVDFMGFGEDELEDTTPRRSSPPSRKNNRRLFTLSSEDEDGESSASDGSSVSEEEEVAILQKSTPPRGSKESCEKLNSQSKKSKRKKQTTGGQPVDHGNENQQGTSDDILKELRKNNEMLTSLVSRIKKTESRLKSVESDLKSGGAVSRSRAPSRKQLVPDEVRRELRRVYRILLEEDIENFEGWKIEPGVVYHDPRNELIVDRLIREIKALNPTFVTQHIKDAAYRYYLSCAEAKSSERRGKSENKKKVKRRHERMVRKIVERKAAVEKATFKDPSEKEKWKGLLKMEIMSSDESDLEDEKEVIISHPLPWLSATVVQFKKKLDYFSLKGKSPQSKRQMKERLEGSPSLRPKPTDKDFPSWVFQK